MYDRKKQKKKSSLLYGCIPYVFPQNRYEEWNNMQKCFYVLADKNVICCHTRG